MDWKCHLSNRLFLFTCACLSGVLFALIWRSYERKAIIFRDSISKVRSLRSTNYAGWRRRYGLRPQLIPEEELFNREGTPHTEAEFLYKKIPVLCLIRCKSSTGAKAVKDTWSKHCNYALLWGDFQDDKIPVVHLEETVNSLVQYIKKKYWRKFEWILAVDDYTFAIVENLRHYVAALNSSTPYYLGHPVQDYRTVYNMEAAGIAISEGAFEKLQAYNGSLGSSCKSQMGVCLGRVFGDLNVPLVDTRDSLLRGRFNPFSPEDMIIPGSISIFSSYWRASLFLSSEGKDCCSDLAITFRGISPVSMYLMEYVVYALSVYRNSPQGLANHPPNFSKQPNRKKNMIEIEGPSGKAVVKLLHAKKNTQASKSKSSMAFHSQSGSFSKLWNDFFSH